MKFKKVELQAFRAYQDKKDGTFDFLLPNGECANFISIYAPNGFGKTSFYDGVEWAITNNINRFLRRKKENADSALAERDIFAESGNKAKQYILRNRTANQNLTGLVNVYTTKEDFKREIPLVLKKGSTDYRFDEKETDATKKYFLDVILTQEWINAFIKEENAEERYKKFITFFGEDKMDAYYNNIVLLIKGNDKKIQDLNKKLAEFQLKLRYDIDEKLLNKVNEQIEELNTKGENIRLVDVGFTDVDFIELSNSISSRTIELNNQKNDLEARLNTLTEQELNIDKYLSEKINLKSQENALNVLKEYEKAVKERIKLNTTLANYNESQSKYLKLKDELSNILNIFPSYDEIRKDIKGKAEEINKIKIDHLKQDKVLDDLNKDIVKLRNKISSIQKQITELENHNKETALLFKEITEKTKLINELKKQLSANTTNLNNKKKESSNFEILIKELEAIQKQIKKEPTVLYQHNDKNGYKAFISQIEDMLELIELNKKLQLENEKETEENKLLNQEITKIISLGNDIINSTKTSSCPLCSQKYDSYSALLETITANKALSSKQKKLLKESNDLQAKVAKLNEDLFQVQTLFIEFIEKEKSVHVERVKALKTDIKNIELVIKQLTSQSNQFQEELNTFLIRTKGLEEAMFLEQLTTDLVKFKKEFDKQNVILKTKSDQKIKAEESVANFKKLIATITESQELLKNNDYYLLVEKYCKDNVIEEITEKLIKNKLAIFEKQINDNKSNIDKANTDIAAKNKKLENVKVENISKEISEIELIISTLKREISLFNFFLVDDIKIKTDIEEKQALVDSFVTVREKISADTKSKNVLTENFQKLEEYRSIILPFIEQSKLKENIKKVEESIAFSKNIVSGELNKEKESISDYIYKQVESFFHETLINALYAKIDPHPEYKKIKFKCDFSGNDPRLDVFVNDHNDNHPIAPSLYFSTAQLNVLSLSIFLAKALHAKDYEGNSVNCIFLDDPIQSMDSINILSTIDLLRSLTVTHGKQIILSTHDENFHALLQKKIPTGLFKSKYLELETFGKVKSE